jgi:hypothetical protein
MKKKLLLRRGLLLCTTACTFMLGAFTAHAQLTKNYATLPVTHSTGALFSGTEDVPDFANASDGIEATAATLNAQTTLVLTTFSYVEVSFPTNVPDGATVYIPIQDDTAQSLLSTLVGGTVGGLLTSIVGEQFLEVEIKTSTGTPIVTYTSENNGPRNFLSGRFNIVKGPDKQIYITFTASPGVNYSRIRINARTSGVLTATYQLKVQDAYYLSGTTTPCNPLLTTSFDATGLTLSLLNSNGDPVKNIERTIDSDTTTFSTFGYGTVNVGALSAISQDIYFSNLSIPGDGAKLKLRVPPSLLSLGIFDNIHVSFYRNDTLLSTDTLATALSVQALGLIQQSLNNNAPVSVQIPVSSASTQFNRVRVTMVPTLVVGANELLELYDVQRVPPSPVVNIPAGQNCPATTLHLSVTNVAAGVSYKWYNNAGAVVSTDSFYNAAVPANGVTDSFYVTSSDCPDVESVATIVPVTGNTADCISVAPISYLQGIYNSTLDRNRDVTADWAAVLAAHATSQPYGGAPFNYAGTESVSASLFTATVADNDIVDWMLLELKDSSGVLIDAKAVFVLENGNVTNIDKTQNVVLKANAGRYHLTLRHRNHLGLSTNLSSFVSGANVVDYTTAADVTLFGDANAFNIVNGKTLMIAGNANGNGFVSYSGSGNDRAVMLSLLGGSNTAVLNSVYSGSDVNLSGSVYYTGTGNDRAIILNVLSGNVNGVVTEQIK